MWLSFLRNFVLARSTVAPWLKVRLLRADMDLGEGGIGRVSDVGVHTW